MSEDEFPARPIQHVVGNQAVLRVRSALPSAWVVREQDGDNDYGIDLEIELASSVVSGQIFKAQVKGHTAVAWNRDATFLQQVRSETLQYWHAMPVPVVLFLVDLDNSAVHWALVSSGAEGTGVRLSRRQRLPQTASELQVEVLEWLSRRGPRALLNDIVLFVERWEEIKQWTHYDFFLSLELEEYFKVQSIYAAVGILRQALGLPYAQILPWELWTARARLTFKEEPLFYGQVDEIVAYLSPLVAEALAAARDKLKREEPTPANVVAKSWAESEGSRSIDYRSAYVNPFVGASSAFWERIERDLKQQGALRYSVLKK